MHEAKGRLNDVIGMPKREEGQVRTVLMLDKLTHVPGIGDVLHVADHAVSVVEVSKQQTRSCLTGHKLSGLGSIAVLVNTPAEELRSCISQSHQMWVTWVPKGELPWRFKSDELPAFTRLNEDWNAEPNDPALNLKVEGTSLLATVRPNPYLYPQYKGISELKIRFDGCSRYRVTPVSDDEWYRGQCRFSGLAPSWGEFYEVSGRTRDEMEPTCWIKMEGAGTRHFHFYLRDETLEVKAQDWSMQPKCE